MKRHAALPYLEDIERMRQKINWIIKQHIAKSATRNNTDQDIVHQAVERDAWHHRVRLAGFAFQKAKTNQQASYISQRVPADTKIAKLDGKFVEFRQNDPS